MSNLKNLVPCCIKVFKQKPDNEGYYIEPTKNQMIDKLLEQHSKLSKYKKAFEIINKHSKVDYIENTNINDLGKDYNLFICEINSIEDKEEYELIEELMKGE